MIATILTILPRLKAVLTKKRICCDNIFNIQELNLDK